MPSLVVPSDVRVGSTVTLYTEPGEDGATLVKRVTTTSITPSGNVKTTTETTRTNPATAVTTGSDLTVRRVIYMTNKKGETETKAKIEHHDN